MADSTSQGYLVIMSTKWNRAFGIGSALIAAFFLLDGCTMSSTITLRPDGSAFVHAYNVWVDRRAYYNKAVILDADTVAPMNVSFVIADIDSLGQYLPWLRFESLQFRQVGDLVTIRSIPGAPQYACGPGWTRAWAEVLVEEGIKAVKFNGVSATRNGKWIIIKRPKRKAKKQKPVDVAIDVHHR